MAGAIGGPLCPIRRIAPIPPIPRIAPIRSIRRIPPIPPISSLSWSGLTWGQFLKGGE
jgi:hypothetical protein